ncbi:hypothetical protein SASPL_112980 [Salvia splendens]|uniref:Uncharacterized protein n=1 Tax=Salvia splendens TaxID=180675 RepID=A0A8X8YC90_SALSN|nr:hypothetical protein SASPL_112980 [Salvia splendens]
MGLAVVVLPLTKLGGAAPLLMVSLLWPFAVKFGFSYGPLREICWDMADALRVLMFRVRRVALDGWRRAMRLGYERRADEENLLALSMLAL